MKINVISKNKAHADQIRKILLDGHPLRQIRVIEGNLEVLTQASDSEFPDLIIIDGLCPEVEEFKMLEQLNQHHPNMAIMLLCQEPSSEFLINVVRVGIKEVLQLPVAPAALQAAVDRIEQKGSLSATTRKQGKTIAFMACKGGSGATFLATNLAYILATRGQKVALLDLNLQFGDASLFISDQIPPNTLADVADNISRLDASFLTSSMVQILPNLGVLAAPEDPELATKVKPEHIETLLSLARTEYDDVILDIGRTLNATSVTALDHADMIFLVLQETLPFIRDAKRLLHALEALGYSKDKIHLIVNRYEKGGDIQLEDVEHTLGMKVLKTVPNSFKEVSASVNQGIPILQIAQHNSVTETLQEMADSLLNDLRPRNGSWLTHLLHH